MSMLRLRHFNHFNSVDGTCYRPGFTFVSNEIGASPVGCLIGFSITKESNRKNINIRDVRSLIGLSQLEILPIAHELGSIHN